MDVLKSFGYLGDILDGDGGVDISATSKSQMDGWSFCHF